MESTVDSRVTVKLFIGISITPDLKLQLSQSSAWKEAKIVNSTDPFYLIETNFHNKTYIGLFSSEQQLSLTQLKGIQQHIREQLHHYCPKFPGIDKLPLFIFPQLFVA